MSLVSNTVDTLISGFNLTAVREIAGKVAHAILDAVAGKAEKEGADLLVAEAAKLGVTLKPEDAAKLIHVVLGHVREHV